MCINYETSILSFLIGNIYGWKLYTSNIKEQKVIGLFSMFISIIQLIEAIIYISNNKNYKNLNRLLAIFLGLQGFFIYFIHDKYFNDKNILYYITLLISLIIIIISLNKQFNSGEKKYNCVDWNFLNNHKIISDLLYVMYGSIYILLSRNKIYNIYSLFLIITYIFSYFIKPIKNTPSMWCLSSALVTPIYYYLN
jgi:hypothetical protein